MFEPLDSAWLLIAENEQKNEKFVEKLVKRTLELKIKEFGKDGQEKIKKFLMGKHKEKQKEKALSEFFCNLRESL